MVDLYQKLNFIGIRRSLTSSKAEKINPRVEWIDIEETLHQASQAFEKDEQLFSLVCSWVHLHGGHVVIEKLIKLQKKSYSPWIVAIAVYAQSVGYVNWKKLIKNHRGKEFALGNVHAVKAVGEHKGWMELFKAHGFLIPKGALRIRETDVFSVAKLIKENRQYKNRFLIGANWRSDIVTAIQKGIDNPSQISKYVGCSYPSAFSVFKDYKSVSESTQAN